MHQKDNVKSHIGYFISNSKKEIKKRIGISIVN